MAKKEEQTFCGILPVAKPEGFTSFDVIAKLRGMLHTKKIGHGGTLDPMATGVLPLFLGTATKLVDFVPDGNKRYVAEIAFGRFSDSGDRTGNLGEEQPVLFNKEELLQAMAEMTGESLQLPPMVSAVKVDGRRLYDLARQGIEVERTPRPITVYDFTLLSYDEVQKSARVSVFCSKGTYIRVLAEDLAKKLKTAAHLTVLERTFAHGFSLEECYSLAEIQAAVDSGSVESLFSSAQRPFDGSSGVKLTAEQTKLFQNGTKLPLNSLSSNDGSTLDWANAPLPVFSEEDKLLGMGEVHPEEDVMRIRRLFHL